MTHRIDIARPLVHLVVVLEKDREHIVVVEVFLQHHEVVAFLHQVLANAGGTSVAGTVSIDL